MARRGRHEGTIYERSDGRWEARIDLGRGIDGRRTYKAVYGATQADVVQALRKVGGQAANGFLLTTGSPTVAEHLEEWFTTNRDDWRASTRRGYRGAIDRFLTPAFGPMRLEKLSPRHVQAWLNEHKQQHGARRRIELAHAVLRSALSEAQRLQLVAINAAELVKVPRPKGKRPIRPLDIDQARAFLTAAQRHRLGALFSVALACGLRLGEATGLKWADVNLDSGEMQIRQQLQVVGKRLELQPLKTDRSRRTLMLPAVCVATLRAHRTAQLQERLKAGDRWGDSGLVFVTRAYKPGKGRGRQVGTALHPRNVLRVFYGILDAAKVWPRIRFHDLRHSAASLLIASGVELVEVSMLLGHAEIRTTSDLYAHLVKQTASKAAKRMDAVLG
jgi:integrase